MEQYIISLDQGTTSSRAVLFDAHLAIAGMARKETKQQYPLAGWVEQDAQEIWDNQLSVARAMYDRAILSGGQVQTIGISNQRESTVVWDRRTGKAVYPVIIWQDKRTTAFCAELSQGPEYGMIRRKTGLLPDPYFSASKISWILDHVPGAKDAAVNGHLLFGTIDSWLIWKMSGGRLHITDASNASRTLLFDIHAGSWDPELLELFGIPAGMLPEVRRSSEIYGKTSPGIFPEEISISGIAGDQQAALFGQRCFQAGMAKNTYGTGCFMLMHTGDRPVLSDSGLLTTVAWNITGQPEYALEGSVFMGGAAVKWLRDGLGIIGHANETEAICRSVNDNGGVFLVPAFAGLGAPYWDADARGMICGLTQGSTAAHIVRATLESIAYQCRDVISVMETDSGIGLRALKVDGGASVNDFLMQFQADILGVRVMRPSVIESTALGAASLAGLACGMFSIDELHPDPEHEQEFSPLMQGHERERLYSAWKFAVQRARFSGSSRGAS